MEAREPNQRDSRCNGLPSDTKHEPQDFPDSDCFIYDLSQTLVCVMFQD